MNSREIKRKEDRILESIGVAYEICAFRGVKHNFTDPEAMAPLAKNLLEQFSGFHFAGSPQFRVTQFVRTYLPKYSKTNLYDILKDPFKPDFDKKFKAAVPKEARRHKIEYGLFSPYTDHFRAFVYDLGEGLKRGSEALKSVPSIRRHALKWYKTHPVNLLSHDSWFSSDDREKISKYYLPNIEKINFSKRSPNPSFELHFGSEGYVVDVCYGNFPGRKEGVRVPLEIFIKTMGLKPLAEVLAREAQVKATNGVENRA
jgi:hypothetical protein